MTISITVGLLLYSVAFTRIYAVDPNSLVFDYLPLTFWIGLVGLGFVWYLGWKNNWVLAIALILTFSYLFIAPAIIRVPVWLSNSYYPFGESQWIISEGHTRVSLLNNAYHTLNSYLDWPIFLYFASTFTQISNLSVELILKYFPIFILSLSASLTFLILKVKLTSKLAIAGTAFFLVGFWMRQFYFGPPGFGLIFFLLGFLILLKIFFTNSEKKNYYAGFFIFIFVITNLTHVLSALMLVLVLFSMILAKLLTREHVIRNLLGLTIFSSVLFVLYNFVTSEGFFNQALSAVFGIFSGGTIGILRESSRVVGSTAQILNYQSTIAIVGIFAVVTLSSVFFSIVKRYGHNFRHIWHISITSFHKNKGFRMGGYGLFMLIFMVILILFAITAQYGPHEGYQRAFLYGLIPLSFFCITFLSKKPVVFCFIITALLVLNIPAQYGADSYTLQTSVDLSGAKFFAEHTGDRITCLYEFSLLQRYYNPSMNVTFKQIDTLPFTSIPNVDNFTDYDVVIISTTQDNYYYYFVQTNPISEYYLAKGQSLTEFNKVYDNSGYTVLTQHNY